MVVNEVTKIYAGALVEIGTEKDILSQIQEDCEFLVQLLEEDTDFREFLNAPVISKQAKKNFVDKVFSGKACDEIVGFLKVLIDNDRQSAFPDIYRNLIELIDEIHKSKRIKVISSIQLESGLIESIKKALGEKLGVDIIVDEEVNSSILGGIIIEVDDIVIDGSITSNLKNMKERLLTRKVMSGVAYED